LGSVGPILKDNSRVSQLNAEFKPLSLVENGHKGFFSQ